MVPGLPWRAVMVPRRRFRALSPTHACAAPLLSADSGAGGPLANDVGGPDAAQRTGPKPGRGVAPYGPDGCPLGRSRLAPTLSAGFACCILFVACWGHLIDYIVPGWRRF